MGYTIFILDFAKLDVYVVLYWIYWLHLQYLICWKLEPINSMDWWVYQSYVDITTGHPPLVLLHQSIDDSQWKMVWLTGMAGDWPNLHRLAGILQGERSCSAYHPAKRSVPCLQGKEHSFNQSSEVEQMVMLGQELEYRCRGTCRSGASYFGFVWKWYQNRFIFKKKYFTSSDLHRDIFHSFCHFIWKYIMAYIFWPSILAFCLTFYSDILFWHYI